MASIEKQLALLISDMQRERANSQMTLGKLIEGLNGFAHGLSVQTHDGRAVSHLRSYRGYYSDLSLVPENAGATTVGDLWTMAQAALGATFQGYKGGNYVMSKTTPLWVSPWGVASGDRLMGLAFDHTRDAVVLIVKQED